MAAKLKRFKSKEALRADDLNAMIDRIESIERGDNLSVKGLRKSYADGRMTLANPNQLNKGGAAGYVCAGFIVSCDAGTGAVSQTASSVSYGGGYDASYAVTYATGTAPASGDRIIQVKIDYTANDQTAYGTGWTLDDVTFQLVTSLTADTTPEWDNATANEWDPVSGVHYSEWANISNRVVTSSLGGGIVLVICSPSDVRVVHGCAADV